MAQLGFEKRLVFVYFSMAHLFIYVYTRVFVYVAGLFYFSWIVFLEWDQTSLPKWDIVFLSTLPCIGFAINLIWLRPLIKSTSKTLEQSPAKRTKERKL